MDRRSARALGTRRAVLAAARELIVASADPPTVGVVAARAGVSRLTVYQHFGSHRGLLEAIAADVSSGRPSPATPPATLRDAVGTACERWAADPALFRRLPAAAAAGAAPAHELASRLAAEDRLRPGCSLREAEDVIAIATSFPAFDRLYQDGRRSTAAVAEILGRMAASILSASAPHPS